MSKRSSTNPLACHCLDSATPPAQLASRFSMWGYPCRSRRTYMHTHFWVRPRAKGTNGLFPSTSMKLSSHVSQVLTVLNRVYHHAIRTLLPKLPDRTLSLAHTLSPRPGMSPALPVLHPLTKMSPALYPSPRILSSSPPEPRSDHTGG